MRGCFIGVKATHEGRLYIWNALYQGGLNMREAIYKGGLYMRSGYLWIDAICMGMLGMRDDYVWYMLGCYTWVIYKRMITFVNTTYHKGIYKR